MGIEKVIEQRKGEVVEIPNPYYPNPQAFRWQPKVGKEYFLGYRKLGRKRHTLQWDGTSEVNAFCIGTKTSSNIFLRLSGDNNVEVYRAPILISEYKDAMKVPEMIGSRFARLLTTSKEADYARELLSRYMGRKPKQE